MSQMVLAVQPNLEELRIRLNRNPDLFTQYPKLRISETVTNEELSEMLSAIITSLGLNPTLKGVNMSSQNLQDANLSGANLNDVDFSDKNMENCKLNYCDLVNTKFNDISATGAEFTYADLTGAEFTGSELSETNFQNTILIGANFSGATMSDIALDNADMTRANVSDAYLMNAEVTGTNLQDIIYNNFTEFPFLDGAINIPEALIAGIPRVNADIQGVAYEIHNVFNKIDIDKYHEIIKKSATSLRRGLSRGNWDLAVIKRAFETIIDMDFPKNETEQALAKTKLNSIINRLKNSDELKQDNVMKLVSDTTQFVFEQKSQEFKVFYVTAFIQDCYHAYSHPTTGLPFETEQGMSCVKGIVERFVWIIGDTVQFICSDDLRPDEVGSTPSSPNVPCPTGRLTSRTSGFGSNPNKCNPLYKELLDVFGKNKLDINELTQQWDEEVLQKSEFQDKTNMTKEQVKQNFINYMKQKYSAVGLWIPSTQELVNKRADELDYAFEGRMFGGSLRNRRNLRKKTARKHRKTQNKKKERKYTLHIYRFKSPTIVGDSSGKLTSPLPLRSSAFSMRKVVKKARKNATRKR